MFKNGIFIPKTRLGKWSGGFTAFFLLYMLLHFFNTYRVALLEHDNEILFLYFFFAPISLGGLFGLLAFIIGLIAIFKKGDRSPAAILSTIIGALTLVWIVVGSWFILTLRLPF